MCFISFTWLLSLEPLMHENLLTVYLINKDTHLFLVSVTLYYILNYKVGDIPPTPLQFFLSKLPLPGVFSGCLSPCLVHILLSDLKGVSSIFLLNYNNRISRIQD
ncbi:hypothetical protein Hanom_Chr05g00439091 [Helianthus anomalus]